MLPVGVLMIEHRLIERMVWLMSNEVNRIKAKGEPDSGFLTAVVDFMVNFTDRCHHGKEEEIYFRSLSAKPLSLEHQKIMRELISEHEYARVRVKEVREEGLRFCGGDYGAILSIASRLQELVTMYTCHIEKEDKQFFLPSMEYFTAQEKTQMLGEFDDFDKNLFKKSYLTLVDAQEAMIK